MTTVTYEDGRKFTFNPIYFAIHGYFLRFKFAFFPLFKNHLNYMIFRSVGKMTYADWLAIFGGNNSGAGLKTTKQV